MIAFYNKNNYSDYLFDSFFNANALDINPVHDVIENDNNYLLEVSLAGFEKENIKTKIEKYVLTIEAERKKDSDMKYNKTSTFFGKYSKSFELSENINTDKITAEFKNGILSLNIPKKEAAKTIKEIAIS